MSIKAYRVVDTQTLLKISWKLGLIECIFFI